MRQFTDDKEIEIVKSNLSQCQSLLTFLGSDWVERELLQKKERSRAHFLFWLLFDKAKSAKLQSWLEVLNDKFPKTKFFGTLNKLRKYREETDFYSLLPEIEVASFYASKGKIDYHPPHADLRFIVDGHEVWFEIAKLFSSKQEKHLKSLSDLVRSRLDNISGNKYVISFRISPDFNKSDVDPFVQYVSSIIAKNTISTQHVEFLFEGGKASVTLYSKKERGHVALSRFEMPIYTAGRLKEKMLSKAQKLPENRFNVLVFDIGLFGARPDHAESAFLGQVVPAICTNRQTGENWTQNVRLENGLIHKEEGKKVSALIYYEDFNYENRKLIPNPMANYPISSEIQSEI